MPKAGQIGSGSRENQIRDVDRKEGRRIDFDVEDNRVDTAVLVQVFRTDKIGQGKAIWKEVSEVDRCMYSLLTIRR